MKRIISLLVFASIIGYVTNSMANNASQAIGKHHVQLQAMGE